MTLETLKSRLDKKETEAKELKKQVKEAELAEQKAQEQIAKLEALSADITEVVQTVLDKAKITLPVGKSITITVGELGLSTSIVNQKPVKTRKGNGGAKSITFEGQPTSWAELCHIKNITRTPEGSAHRDVYNRDKDLHDSIQHECSIDHKVYPVS
jgi:hypothetical protein